MLQIAVASSENSCDTVNEKLLRSLELSPVNVAALTSLGGIYFDTGNYKASIEEYTKAINLQPSGNLRYMRGVVYQHYGKPAEAAEDFKAAGLEEKDFPKF